MPAASLIIAAAGRGRRFAANRSRSAGEPPTKAFALLAGRPVLAHTLDRFAAVEAIAEAVVAVPGFALETVRTTLGDRFGGERPLRVVVGGEDRLDSVAAALKVTDGGTELVVIHDAVRPLIRPQVVEEAMRVAVEHGAAVVGRRVDHTVKRAPDGLHVTETVSREGLWLAQTPQVFRREVIIQAYARRADVVGHVTDDAQLVEAMGYEVAMVPGDAANIKITTPEDLRTCEALLKAGWPFEPNQA